MNYINRLPKFKGEWRDTVIDCNGNVIDITEWESNQAQDSWGTICAQLFVNSRTTNASPVNGFMYVAIGQGDASWDTVSPNKDYTATTLLDEIDRIKIVPERDIVYLNPLDDSESASPTRKIKITTRIQPDRAIGNLREFGIVIGDATDITNSGTLFNWVDHSLRTHNLTNPTTIIREITIKFLTEDEVTIV